jgi:hypothetical protein
MPYTNIVWVKFKLELLSDYRFTDKLNDSQKLIYLGLLLLAGNTRNHIPVDENYIKRNLNLAYSLEQIKNDIGVIITIFPKIQKLDNFLYFNNFRKLHNFKIKESWEKNRKEIGNKKELPEKSKRRVREDKEKINKIRFLEFVLLTQDQYSKLCADFTKEGADERIKKLNLYIGSKGDKYKSHYHTILNWEHKDNPKPTGKMNNL